MNYLDTLNEKQREAVLTTSGPLLILAGAGSGKTKALTCRIARMLDEGVSPYSILAITFTNKAAKEMKARVTDLVGPQAGRMWISTFHSFGARFLRREIGRLPAYTNQFTIYDAQDTKQVIKAILREINLDDKQFQPAAIQNRISNAKNALQSAKEMRAQAEDFYAGKVAEIYAQYERVLQSNNALDFDDLLLLPAQLLQQDNEVREKYRDRFRYILIDEYQDTNHAQYILARMLVGEEQNICVVGDVDQSIYSWRGADIQNIIDFQRDYPGAKLIKLEQNYRSTDTILTAANEVIRHNTNRPPKKLWTDRSGGEKICYFEAVSERDEAQFVATEVERLGETGLSRGDIAVLYRTNAQSRAIEEAFVRSGVPYTIVGGTRFYDRQEIKDLLAYLKSLQNPRDDISVKRIINVPKRGIGATTVERLEAHAAERGISFFEAVMEASAAEGLGAQAEYKVTAFGAFLLEMMNLAATGPVADLLEEILTKTDYITSLLNAKDAKGESRVENVGELISVAKEFDAENGGTLTEFLEEVALVNDVDQYENQAGRVTLMTLHSAKGLEFPAVFLIGMDEGLFPHARTFLDEAELEEERRLCYVGITRAERRLYLTHAGMRTTFGTTTPYLPSRFLAEIPSELIETRTPKRSSDWQGAAHRDRESRRTVAGLAVVHQGPKPRPSARYDWQVGDRVKHAKWGVGKVLEVRGEGERMQLQLEFPTQGVRLVMVKFAPLTKE